MPHHGHHGASRGIITGYTLKLIRESIPASQEHLAANLGVDRTTVQSWETGRRPFPSVTLRQATALRSHMTRLGADTTLLAILDDAVEADYLLDAILDADPTQIDLDQHPLGWCVLTHRLTELLHWAAVGKTPALLASSQRRTPSRRGPVASTPVLEPAAQRTFFANVQTLAERTARRDERLMLLHRQACFLAGIDPTGAAASWLAQISASSRSFTTFHTWTPRWPDARSVATSLAQQGDPQPLRDFIARAHPDDTCHLAALNYSAYWVGEVHQRQHSDLFMTDPTMPWRGTRFLRHLVDRLAPGHPFIDLNVHNLWALLAARRGLLHDSPSLGRALLDRAEQTLDTTGMSPQSRQELTSILYGLRMDGLTPRGPA